jgi:hypothetical protein
MTYSFLLDRKLGVGGGGGRARVCGITRWKLSLCHFKKIERTFRPSSRHAVDRGGGGEWEGKISGRRSHVVERQKCAYMRRETRAVGFFSHMFGLFRSPTRARTPSPLRRCARPTRLLRSPRRVDAATSVSSPARTPTGAPVSRWDCTRDAWCKCWSTDTRLSVAYAERPFEEFALIKSHTSTVARA